MSVNVYIAMMSSSDDILVMQIRTPNDLGALIRQRRRDLSLDQRTLAERAGVSRQWIVEVEAGKPRAEARLVLRALDVAEHGPSKVEPFLWGLLPDNEIILQRWARRFQVSASSAFALLAHVGEDCPGAVRFVLPERLETVTGQKGKVDWLDEAGVAE